MAIDMFLKVDGVTGESAESKHKEWIDIVGYTWGASQIGSMSAGGGGGSGKVSFHDLHVNTTMDRAVPALLKNCAAGNHLSQVKLSICKAGGTQIEYSTIVLKDVIVTDIKFVGGDNDEQVHVDYGFQSSAVELHYWTQLASGGKGPETQMGWDIKANKATA